MEPYVTYVVVLPFFGGILPCGGMQGAEINPACTAAGLEGFPTWVIGGKKFSGEQTFDQLDAALVAAQN